MLKSSFAVFVVAVSVSLGCTSATGNGEASSFGGINTMVLPSVVSECSSAVRLADARCTTCLQSNCASEKASFASACTTFVSCEAACGCEDSCTCSLAPASVMGGSASPACVNAQTELETCTGMCDAECSEDTSSNGG